MPAISETTDHAKHFGMVNDTSCSTGVPGLPIEIVTFLGHSHPTKTITNSVIGGVPVSNGKNKQLTNQAKS